MDSVVDKEESKKNIFIVLYELYKEYIYANKLVIFWSVVIAILCFGYVITNPTLSIDSETIMYGDELAQLRTGRFGLFLIKKLYLYQYLLMPYTTNFFSATVFLISALIWCFNFSLLYNNPKISKISQLIFVGLYLSLPSIVSEFMIFYVCNFEFTIAMMFIALSISFLLQYFRSGLKNNVLFATFLAFFATSIYQAFSSMFIASVIICIFVQIISKKERLHLRNITRIVLPYAIVSLASTVLYVLVNFIIQLFYPTQGYVENYIGWTNSKNITEVLTNILKYIKKFNTDGGFFGGQFIGYTTFAFVAFCLYVIFKSKGINKLYILVISLLTLISPYILPFVLGGGQPIRSMESLLPWVGSIWLIIINSFTVNNNNKLNIWFKIVKFSAATFALLMILWQIQLLNMLFYGNHLRYELDKEMAHNIANEVMKEPGFSSGKPIVFINNYTRQPNKNILVGEVVGHSFFDWSNETNGRSTFFLNTLGYNFNTSSELAFKYKDSKEVIEMSNWPSEGSVKEFNDAIVIKLAK